MARRIAVVGTTGTGKTTLALGQADLVVWLDLSLATIFRMLWLRTWRRIRTQEELFGGNRETWRDGSFSRDSLFVWAVKAHFRRRRTPPAELEGRDSVRLRSQREADEWLAGQTSAR